MDVSELDADEHLLMREAVEVVGELSVVVAKVDVEFCLEQELASVDVVEPQEPRVKAAVHHEAQDTAQLHGVELAFRFSVRVEEASDAHGERCRLGVQAVEVRVVQSSVVQEPLRHDIADRVC